MNDMEIGVIFVTAALCLLCDGASLIKNGARPHIHYSD